jgi:hypothetical protein
MYGVLLYADAGVDERTGNEESYNQGLEYELHDEGVDARRISSSISEPDGARLRNMSTGMTSFPSFGSRASSGTHGLPFVTTLESGCYEPEEAEEDDLEVTVSPI